MSAGEVAHLGNLVLVQHPGGYITAYGNNEAVLVKKGDAVKKGEDHRQGRARLRAGATSPRLHFEVETRAASRNHRPDGRLLPPQ